MPRISYAAKREALYARECRAAKAAGRGDVPICNICDLPVEAGRDWDESHIPVPKAHGGRTTGIAHRLCNRRHNNLVVTPAVAKGKRVRRRHLGILRPGMGKHRMACGKDSRLKKKITGEVVPRVSILDQIRATLKSRRIIA